MTFLEPRYHIPRRPIVGHEGEWVKIFNPPIASPPTPELLQPTNPVPAFVAATVPGASMLFENTVRVDLMHTRDFTMWDGKKLDFFLIGNLDIPATKMGTFPAPTIRIPRGVVFHALVTGHMQAPHTIHWHGIEPTAMNDGVGHSSMELGLYTYQWQPNFIGSYFYHCHRNTFQHFEYGLYGFMIIEPPDAFDGSNAGGYPRRTAANLEEFPEFPNFIGGKIDGDGPHAMTVSYDVEALWILDDVDSVSRKQAHNAHQTIAKHGDIPGINDQFRHNDLGEDQFFSFHDYNPDYFMVTGEFFPTKPGTKTSFIRSGVTIPRELNSGVAGMQVSISAKVNQTILIRLLCAAYSIVQVTFPIDVVVIAKDGRALGVQPFGKYNHSYKISAGNAITMTTAQRVDVLLRTDRPLNDFAQVEFRHHISNNFLLSGKIPIIINK